MQEVRVSAEPIAISVNVLLHHLMILKLVLPRPGIVVRFCALKSVQHRLIVAHDLGESLNADFAIQRIILVKSHGVHFLF
jgi:hypothetical protein